MQPSRILLLAGAATAGAISLAGFAYAGDSGLKTLSLQLPGGQVEQIQYSGPVSPQVAVLPAGNPFAPPHQDPFASLERLSAMMNSQVAAMMQVMQLTAAAPVSGPNPLVAAGVAAIPSGGSDASFTFISLSGGTSGACMRSVAITSSGNGAAPRIVSHSAGNCAPLSGGAPVATPLPARPPATVPAIDETPQQVVTAPHLMRVRDMHPVGLPRASQT